jgi:hypothetical protein
MEATMSQMTRGKFFQALAKLAGKYAGGRTVHKVLVSMDANKCGLDIDDDGPYEERDEIVLPLIEFLKAVSAGDDVFYRWALAELAWEVYERYLVHVSARIHAAALAGQSQRQRAC